uniref:DUF4378 domain-containing protein n=1 Tax=Kalanchoe fedtschenkoi TaxID=63787 RepID=A0A7N0TV98_KALFE
MRKNVYRKQGSIQLENHHPGCMWGVLHMLDHPGFRQVRKMLPYKRHAAKRHHQVTLDQIKERVSDSNHSTKGSVRSRLRARIVEDILRRKAKNHTSSTYPTQSESKPTNDLNVQGKTHDNALESDNRKQLVNSNMLIQETLENAKQALLEQKLMSAKDHTSETPLYQSKEFLDALDLVNLDKELLQGILQEQGSSHLFQSQKSLKLINGVGKSGMSSVPGSGSTSPKNLKQKLEASAVDGEFRFNSATKASEEGSSVLDDSEIAGSPSMRNREKSQVAIMHFKILRRRLRHAIKESKKEKHRIAMDGVLHKIPYGHKLSADVNEITRYWKEHAACKIKKFGSARSCGSSPIHQKAKVRHFRRTSSTGDSMEKYCWLYESSFNKKPDESPSEVSIEINKEEQTKKSLGRILSMPDLKSYYYIPTEYLNDSYASRSPIRSAADAKSVINRAQSFAFEPLNEVKLPSAINSLGADELAESLGNSTVTEQQLNCKPYNEVDAVGKISTNLTTAAIGDQGPEVDQDFDFSFPQNLTYASDQSDTYLNPPVLVEPDEADSSQQESNWRNSVWQPDSRDEVEFKYVKNVLDLAGLSRNHPQESWHASDQPVDPAVYEEVQGCTEEGGSYNHLILFDLINEVLMDMYEKSFSYCPVPLSSLCRLRSMPTGDRVLIEVWSNISCYFSSRPLLDDTLDYVVGRDLAKSSGWMNLQFDTECVGLELEDMIFDDLLDESFDN